MNRLARTTFAAVALLAVTGLAACDDGSGGTAGGRSDVPTSPAAGACLVGSTDCADIPGSNAE